MGTVLVLGGTSEARALAAALDAAGLPFVSSLAGRVQRPVLPLGAVRTGGFGGIDGLAEYLVREAVTCVIDATHPFAEQITHHAVAATTRTGIPLLRLQRPGWASHPLAGEFIWVDTLKEARTAAESAGHRPLLTTGRQGISAFLSWVDRPVVARVIDPPEIALPASWEVICTRGPFAYAAERALVQAHGVDVVVTKDSGGSLTEPKLRAAHDEAAAVIVVRRPPLPDGVEVVASVDATLARLGLVQRTGPSGPVAS